MKPSLFHPKGGRSWRFATSAQSLFLLAAAVYLASGPAWAGGPVATCTESALRAAMAGGGTVNFACDGTITLSSPIAITNETVLDGSGHQVTVSGNHAVQVFFVDPSVNFSVSNLTIANGYAGSGGAILNSGNASFYAVTFRDNLACGLSPGASGSGGAAYNSGTMSLDLCQLSGNTAQGASGRGPLTLDPSTIAPGNGFGGALYNSGQLTIDRTTIFASGASGGSGYAGQGITGSLDGSSGGRGADAFGGAIYNVGSLLLARSTIYGNTACGGTGGRGGNGTLFMDTGGNGGAGGYGGSGVGGALYNLGFASLVNCTLTANTAQGGSGGTGGTGAGYVGGSGHGGNGGGGGAGITGDVLGTFSMTNCTLAWNQAVPGGGGAGGAGSYGNPTSGWAGLGGSASGAAPAGSLLNVLLVSNTPASGNTFMAPNLGPLADNGGPTLTMALLPGSPAIDAGSALGAPASDQRGVSRPQGPGVDLGAFEYQYRLSLDRLTIQGGTHCQLLASGLWSNQSLTLEASSNLLTWLVVSNFVATTNGGCQLTDPVPTQGPSRFYRLKTGN